MNGHTRQQGILDTLLDTIIVLWVLIVIYFEGRTALVRLLALMRALLP